MSGTKPTCLEMAPLPEHCHSFMAHGGGTPPLTCPRVPCPAQLSPVLVDRDPNKAESWRWSHTVHAEPLAAGMGADWLLESWRGKGTRPRSNSSGGWSWRPQEPFLPLCKERRTPRSSWRCFRRQTAQQKSQTAKPRKQKRDRLCSFPRLLSCSC